MLSPPSQVVKGRDLSGPGQDTVSTFDLPPNPQYYRYLTNDHDLIALKDGTVLYLTGAGSIEPVTSLVGPIKFGSPNGLVGPGPAGEVQLAAQPAWWNYAYRGNFGPGARSILMTWRSVDCGSSFHYLSEMDPAQMEDGTCANPQPVNPPVPGRYDMGGSDGQLVKLNPDNGDLYLTFQCVGKVSATDALGKFYLTPTSLNKSLIAVSRNGGGSWQSMGFLPLNWWRMGFVALGNQIAFGAYNNLLFARPAKNKLAFSPVQPLTGQWGLFDWAVYPFNPNPNPDPYVASNVWGTTVIARAGDSQAILLAYPSLVEKGNGYSVFIHDSVDSGLYTEIVPITPRANSTTSYVMDLTAVDLGQGPVLLYWTDVNASTHISRVRGRLIVAVGRYSSDFDITGDIDLTQPSNNANGKLFFYGDYHTAGGYTERIPQGRRIDTVYRFLPLWVDRTGGARFTEIRYPAPASATKQLEFRTVPAEAWRLPPPTVDLLSIRSLLPHKEVDREFRPVDMQAVPPRKQ